MNRADAEQLALAYAIRNLAGIRERHPDYTPAQVEKHAVIVAQARYGSSLSTAAMSRIRRELRAARPR